MSDVFVNSSMFKLFYKFCVPNVISAAFLCSYYVIDGIFVGLYLGSDALAAMGLVMPFIMMCFALADMIAIGSSVQISIHLGQDKRQRAKMIFSASILLIFLLACSLAVLAYLSYDFLLSLLNISAKIKALAKEYVFVFICFAPLIMLSFAMDNYLRICAKTFYSMCVNIAITIINISLVYIFIAHLKLGLLGAALATCIGYSIGTLLCFLPFIFCKLSLNFSSLYMNFRLFRNIIYNGSSEFFNTISFALFVSFANAVLLELGGVNAVAVFSIILYIDAFISVLIIALGDSMQAAFSYNFGAKNLSRIKKILNLLFSSSFIVSFSSFLGIYFFHQHILALFINKNEAEVFTLANEALLSFAFIYIFLWFNISTSSFLTALNKPGHSLLIALSRNCFLPILGLYTLPLFLGLDGVFASLFISNVLTFFLSIFFIKKTFKNTF